jgi:hypothetical protein
VKKGKSMRIVHGMISSMAALLILGSVTVFGHSHGVRHDRGVFSPVIPEYHAATGHVVLNYAPGKGATIVQVNLRGLEPNAHYYFNLTHGRPPVGFVTRRNGTASIHYELSGHHAGHLPAYVWDADEMLVLSTE